MLTCLLLFNYLSQSWRPLTLQKMTVFNFVCGGGEGAGSYLMLPHLITVLSAYYVLGYLACKGKYNRQGPCSDGACVLLDEKQARSQESSR